MADVCVHLKPALADGWRSGSSIHRLAMNTFILFAVACAPTRDDANDGHTVTVLSDGDESILGPNFDLPEQFLMFLPFVARTAEGGIEGRLVRSWEPSDDYRSWTMHVNTEVRWHDGVPVTSHDVAFTAELLRHPDVGYFGADPEIEVLDDSTFMFRSTTHGPLNDFRVFYPKHILDTLDPTEFYEWEFWTKPVGNGPYRYVRHVANTFMELEANPDYFGGKPKIDRVILRFGASGLQELLAGNVHALSIPPLDIAKIEQNDRFQISYQRYDWGQTAVFWNHRTTLFSDRRVRRAATLGINRRELLSVLNLPLELPLFDVIQSGRQWQQVPEPIPYDPDQARRLLEESGWHDGDGDGIRDRDGIELRFTLITDAADDRPAVFLQDQLRRIGMQMEIQTLGGVALIYPRIRDGEFEAALCGWDPGHEGMFGAGSFLGYHNEAVIGLLEAISATGNPGVVDSLYRETWPHFQADVPVTYLFPRISVWVSDRRIRGLRSPFRGHVVWYLEDLWWEDR